MSLIVLFCFVPQLVITFAIMKAEPRERYALMIVWTSLTFAALWTAFIMYWKLSGQEPSFPLEAIWYVVGGSVMLATVFAAIDLPMYLHRQRRTK